MRMSVYQALMAVPVAVRFPRRIGRGVEVPVVLIVDVAVLMLHRLVNMLVLMPLGQMQPQASGHQHTSAEQPNRERLRQDGYSKTGSDERGQ